MCSPVLSLSGTLSPNLLFQQCERRKSNKEGRDDFYRPQMSSLVSIMEGESYNGDETYQINREEGRLWLAPKIIWHYSWKMTQHDSANSPGGHWSAELPDEPMTAWVCVSLCPSPCLGTDCGSVLSQVMRFIHAPKSQLKRCLPVVDGGNA